VILAKLLLDTHAFLWAASDPARLSVRARAAIEDPSADVYVSAAVAWEIVIKHGLKKLKLPLDPSTYVTTRVAGLGFNALPIALEHALAVASLPKHHNDPFDRIMIAQAQIEGLTFVTTDAAASRYPVRVLKAA
jgi:PIN domain nuclease of toxin-antitoxin system